MHETPTTTHRAHNPTGHTPSDERAERQDNKPRNNTKTQDEVPNMPSVAPRSLPPPPTNLSKEPHGRSGVCLGDTGRERAVERAQRDSLPGHRVDWRWAHHRGRGWAVDGRPGGDARPGAAHGAGEAAADSEADGHPRKGR